MTTDQTAKTTIYYTPYVGSVAPFWDGTTWTLVILAELSLALDSSSGHTGYHQSAKNFDVFLDYNGGTPRLVSGPAWSSDTARASAIARQNGVWLNSASMTARFGTGSGDTATHRGEHRHLPRHVPGLGRWPDASSSSAASAAGGASRSLLLWNAYNRVPVSASSWTARPTGPIPASAPTTLFNAERTAAASTTASVRARLERGHPVNAWLDSGKSGSGRLDLPPAIGVDCDTTFCRPLQGFKDMLSTSRTRRSAIAPPGGLGFHYLQAAGILVRCHRRPSTATATPRLCAETASTAGCGMHACRRQPPADGKRRFDALLPAAATC